MAGDTKLTKVLAPPTVIINVKLIIMIMVMRKCDLTKQLLNNINLLVNRYSIMAVRIGIIILKMAVGISFKQVGIIIRRGVHIIEATPIILNNHKTAYYTGGKQGKN